MSPQTAKSHFRMYVVTFLSIVLAACLFSAYPASAQNYGTAPVKTLVPLPADLQGELNGVAYRIRVPANWNGTLLVYSYGYADLQSATAAPPLAPPPLSEETLLAQGFALAGVHAAGGVPIPPASDAGWNFKERMQNTVALTAAFHGMVGRPQRTIAWGRSMGGLVTLALIEGFPGLYDAAIPLCALAAGTPRMFDQKLDVRLAYAVVFQTWKDAWGTPGNVRPDLNFGTEVAPVIGPQLTSAHLWQWEFLRLVNGIPPHASLPDPSFYANFLLSNNPFVLQTMWLAFAPAPDLDQRAGGQVAENVGRVYSLDDEDRTYLESYGVSSETLDTLLAEMNEQRIYASDRNARNYANHYYNPTGRITQPVLMLHTTKDAAAIPNNESAYQTAVENQGKEELLMQEFSTGNGMINTHCTFTPAQELAAIDAMMSWLGTGTPPNPSLFFTTTLGFAPDYVPDPWPW